MLSAAFEAQSAEWAARHPASRWSEAWQAQRPAGLPGLRLHGAPLRLSAALDAALRQRAQALGAWLQSQAAGWPDLNVVCADLLLCEGEPWTLGWVEFQAFTSVAASVDWLHEIALPLWPELEGLDAQGLGLAPSDWRRAYGDWVRGGAARGAVAVIEHQPWQQSTACDFHALQQRLGWPVVEPAALQIAEGRVLLGTEPLAALLNRVVEPDYPLAASPAWRQLCAQRSLHWHSPPWLFGAVSKRLLVDWHRADPGQRIDALPLADWRQLGLPAEQLVAKPVLGLGGQGVLLGPDAATLDALAAREPQGDWVVQRRLQPLAFTRNRDGLPLQIEIRLMLDCTPAGPIRLVSRLGRVSRWGQAANVARLAGVEGEGLALLFC